jgi:hypothetical protein
MLGAADEGLLVAAADDLEGGLRKLFVKTADAPPGVKPADGAEPSLESDESSSLSGAEGDV